MVTILAVFWLASSCGSCLAANLVAVLIAPIVVQYQDATGTTMNIVCFIGLALIGVLAWAVRRSEARATLAAAAPKLAS